MYRLSTNILFLSLMLMQIDVSAQKALSEATIVYDIVVTTNSDKPTPVDVLDGAESVLYLKGKSSRTDMKSALGTESTIIDAKAGNITMLKEYGGQKFMINLTPDNWKESNKKFVGVKYKFENVFKDIIGYKCQKAIGTMADSSSFVVYFTKDLLPTTDDFQYINKGLPGLAMQYEAKTSKQIISYTVSQINFDPIPAAKFDIPKTGYRVIAYEETKK